MVTKVPSVLPSPRRDALVTCRLLAHDVGALGDVVVKHHAPHAAVVHHLALALPRGDVPARVQPVLPVRRVPLGALLDLHDLMLPRAAVRVAKGAVRLVQRRDVPAQRNEPRSG